MSRVEIRKGDRLRVTFEAMKAFGEWSNATEGPVVEALRAEAPRGRTEELAEGIYPVQKANELRLEFHATVDYAGYVIHGTAPHWIGSPIDIPGVGWRYIGEHPGTRANDFPQRVMSRLGGEWTRSLAAAMAKVVKIYAD